MAPAGVARGHAGDWWQPFAQVDDVAVVHVDLVPDTDREHQAFTWLDPEEQGRAARFQHEGARRRYVLCRASLRSLLSDALDYPTRHLAFDTAAHGKPFATVDGRPAPISFNVSHSGRHGLIALALRGRVGVDVEERVAQPNLDVLIDAVLGCEEKAEVTAAGGRSRLDLFLRLWTMKEALSKAHGEGMSMDVSAFEIPRRMREGSQRGVIRLAATPEVAWRLSSIGTDRFEAAVAHEGDER